MTARRNNPKISLRMQTELSYHQLKAQHKALLAALQRVMDVDCPLTGNPSHTELVEFWEYEKTQGRGEAEDRLFALAAIEAAKA